MGLRALSCRWLEFTAYGHFFCSTGMVPGFMNSVVGLRKRDYIRCQALTQWGSKYTILRSTFHQMSSPPIPSHGELGFFVWTSISPPPPNVLSKTYNFDTTFSLHPSAMLSFTELFLRNTNRTTFPIETYQKEFKYHWQTKK